MQVKREEIRITEQIKGCPEWSLCCDTGVSWDTTWKFSVHDFSHLLVTTDSSSSLLASRPLLLLAAEELS